MRIWRVSSKPMTLVGSAIVLGCPMFAHSRTEHGSFLERRANTIHQLIAELNDPRVLDRYERHFGLDKKQLQNLFQSLQIGQLRQPGAYVVYNADSSGRINWKNLKLRLGTRVFCDKAGKPVLKFSCGNPMKPGSDRKGIANAANSHMGEPQDQLRQCVEDANPNHPT